MATIPIFNGDNYNFWCVKMKTLFLSKGLWDTVENGYKEPKATFTMTKSQEIQLKNNQQNDAAALSNIQQGVSDSIFPIIMKATKAKEAWDILRQEFQGDAKDQNLNEANDDQPTHQMDSDLYEAAMNGCINDQMQNKDRINVQKTPNRNTVLHIAALFGQTKCVIAIVKMNPSLSLHQANVKGDTALHLAAREGHFDVVKELIACAIKLDHSELESGSEGNKEKMLKATNEDGDTALHDAVRNYPRGGAVRLQPSDSDLVSSLKKADPEQPSHSDLVSLLIKADPEFTYPANNAGETPLYIAAERGYHKVVSEILNTCRAPPPAYGGPGGRTALHAAVIHYNKDITETLLRWNKDLAKEADMYGWTPLHYAAQFGRAEAAETLLGQDGDKSIAYLTVGKDDKQTALHIAASQGHVDVMEKLISKCPDCWEMVNDKGQNILHVAVQNEKMKVIEYIVNKSSLSSHLNQKDVDGNTPLHLLVATECIAYDLIDRSRVDKMYFNKENWTPLDVLRNSGVFTTTQRVMKSELKKNGAAPGWRNVISEGEEVLTMEKKALVDNGRILPIDIKKVGDTQLIVAALIATVTFAAGFTVPGGYDANDGPNQGMAILIRQTAFRCFLVTDTLALMFATCAVFIYFLWTMSDDMVEIAFHYTMAGGLVIYAVLAMVMAFITGTYVVLSHSTSFANSVCALGCAIFVTYFLAAFVTPEKLQKLDRRQAIRKAKLTAKLKKWKNLSEGPHISDLDWGNSL